MEGVPDQPHMDRESPSSLFEDINVTSTWVCNLHYVTAALDLCSVDFFHLFMEYSTGLDSLDFFPTYK